MVGSHRVPADSSTSHARASLVDIDGQQFRVSVRGPPGASPLLICNGLGANLEVLNPLISELPDMDIISFDAPGVGRSSTPLLPYRLPWLAKQITRLLDKLGYTDVNVLGLSWGGAVAQQLALAHPDRVKRLILAATGAGAFAIPGNLVALSHLVSPLRYLIPAYLVRFGGQIYGGQFRTDKDFARRHASLILPPARLGYVWQLMAISGWTSIHRLHNIQQPTLVLAGDDDPLVPVINAKILACSIPNAELEVMSCGHLFVLTQAADVAGRLRVFLHD